MSERTEEDIKEYRKYLCKHYKICDFKDDQCAAKNRRKYCWCYRCFEKGLLGAKKN